MSDTLFPVKPEIAASAIINADTYAAMNAQVAADPNGFWADQAKRVAWITPPSKTVEGDFHGDVKVTWYADGTLNATVSCLDRHLATRGDQVAIIWESDDPSVSEKVTYRQLHERVCRFANALTALGAQKGDRICIYLPMVVEAAVAMLACARIGAIHTVVFGGFSPDSLANRIQDAGVKILITADEGRRGGRKVPLKTNADTAIAHCPTIEHVVVVKVTGGDVPMQPGRDHDYATICAAASAICPPVEMAAEDPLFILYTSGSTGKPKGVLHTTGGYLLYAAMTHHYVFDYHDGDVYWCTADVGWVTGHSYVVYGPLCNGGISLMFEGIPTYPTADRFWRIIDKYQVNIFYTAPTAIRMLMGLGEELVKHSSRQSLRILGSVGEPINPEAWEWYYHVVGDARCPVVDTWWQTETGGIMITPLPGATRLKPGSATLPFFGVVPAILDGQGEVVEGEAEGVLVILSSWPGQSRTVYGNHQRFKETYFSLYPDKYFTGDGAKRDADGYYWITGRVDDVLNVSGHRMGTAEIESALVLHEAVAEAAVVGYPHDLKGQGIYAYVTLGVEVEPSEALKQTLTQWVRHEIGSIATPDVIQWAPSLPKTRSGKIMRRILRKVAANEIDNLGDVSTLADPSVLEDIIEHRANKN